MIQKERGALANHSTSTLDNLWLAERLPAGGEPKILAIQEYMHLIETARKGENITVQIHVAPHAFVINVAFQMFGDLRATLCDFFGIVGNALVASHVIIKGAFSVFNVTVIVIEH